MSEYEYPTDEQLDRIRHWQQGIRELIEYLWSIWWMPDWGFKSKWGYSSFPRRRVLKLELHTGGWSGNESIIEALQENKQGNIFWFMYWERSTKGGHYWFEIPKVVMDE